MGESDNPFGMRSSKFVEIRLTPDGIEMIGAEGDMPPVEALRALAQLFEGSFPVRFEFGSAHYNYTPMRNLSREDNEVFRAKMMDSHTKSLDGLPFIDPFVWKNDFAEEIKGMHKKETTLNLERGEIHPMAMSTRDALDLVFTQVATSKGKKVAVPLPNWHFWNMRSCGKDDFTFFDARSEGELVRNFGRAAKKENLGAIVLVNPSNPLMYRLSEQGVKECDRIAEKHGVTIVVDDVLRGTLPIGERETIASYVANPVVVEGFGKRFGDEIFGNASYVWAPESFGLNDFNGMPLRTRRILGEYFKHAYRTDSKPAADELKARNGEFDRGFLSAFPDAKLSRPFPTNLTTLIETPKSIKLSAEQIFKYVCDRGAVVFTMHGFYPKGYDIPKDVKKYLRATIGQIEREDMYESARSLGKIFQDMKDGRR